MRQVAQMMRASSYRTARALPRSKELLEAQAIGGLGEKRPMWLELRSQRIQTTRDMRLT
jgi:hypothetical protein